MNYYYAQNVPLSLMTKEPRKYVKENDIEAIKGMIFRGLWEIDDPQDPFSKHTLLHDAVVMNRQELFDFLIL